MSVFNRVAKFIEVPGERSLYVRACPCPVLRPPSLFSPDLSSLSGRSQKNEDILPLPPTRRTWTKVTFFWCDLPFTTCPLRRSSGTDHLLDVGEQVLVVDQFVLHSSRPYSHSLADEAVCPFSQVSTSVPSRVPGASFRTARARTFACALRVLRSFIPPSMCSAILSLGLTVWQAILCEVIGASVITAGASLS